MSYEHTVNRIRIFSWGIYTDSQTCEFFSLSSMRLSLIPVLLASLRQWKSLSVPKTLYRFSHARLPRNHKDHQSQTANTIAEHYIRHKIYPCQEMASGESSVKKPIASLYLSHVNIRIKKYKLFALSLLSWTVWWSPWRDGKTEQCWKCEFGGFSLVNLLAQRQRNSSSILDCFASNVQFWSSSYRKLKSGRSMALVYILQQLWKRNYGNHSSVKLWNIYLQVNIKKHRVEGL